MIKIFFILSLPIFLGLFWKLNQARGHLKKDKIASTAIVLFFWSLMSGVPFVTALVTAIQLNIVTNLPISLVENDIKKAGQMSWWILVLGAFYGISLLPFGIDSPWLWFSLSILISFCYSILVICHRKFYEPDCIWVRAFGVLYGCVAAFLIYE